MAERNPYQNDFFLNICRALALKEIATKNGRHIILVDDITLGTAFLKTCRIAAISARWSPPKSKAQNSILFSRCRALGSGLKIALRHWRLGKKHKASPNSTHQPNAIWLMNWASDTTFHLNQTDEADTFYGVLATQLEKSSPPIIWLANPMSWLMSADKISKSISSAKKNVVSTFEFITLRTIINAVLGWLMFGFSIRRQFSFNDFDLSPIIIYTARQEQSKPQIILALLYADIATILVEQNLQPKAIVYPFENQPWEKILLREFRKHSSSTKMIAMQHTPFADNYVSSIPSEKQWQENIVPDTLVAIGKEFYERLIENSAPIKKLEIGGFYRNPTLAANTNHAPRPRDTEPLILVSCPMNQQDSIELVHKTAIATKDIKNIQIIVNFHPMSGPQMIENIKEKVESFIDCSHMNFVNDRALKWLEKCSVLIYNSSGTVFDAASLNIPTIYLGPENRLDLDKMPGGSRLSCRTAEALGEIIQQLTTDSSLAEDVSQQTRKALKYCFSQPNPETWNKVISFNSPKDQL